MTQKTISFCIETDHLLKLERIMVKKSIRNRSALFNEIIKDFLQRYKDGEYDNIKVRNKKKSN